MEPNKLDTEFRKKLNQREIQPSPHAWDRLDAMLTAAEGSKPKRNYSWIYIAASFIGILLIASLFFSRQHNPEVKNPVAIEIEASHDSTTPSHTSEPALIPLLKPNIDIVTSPQNHLKLKRHPQAGSVEQAQTAIADRSPNNLHTEIKLANSDKSPIVDSNSLLASVESPSEIKKQSITIDPNSLLSQVDRELEFSFREKVIKTVRKKYTDVKVAFVNRNLN